MIILELLNMKVEIKFGLKMATTTEKMDLLILNLMAINLGG